METCVRRTFTAPTLAMALSAMKAELGVDALIVEQKKVKQGGTLGFGGREVVTVVGELRGTPPPQKRRSSAGITSDTIARVLQSARDVRKARNAHSWVDDADFLGEVYGGGRAGAGRGPFDAYERAKAIERDYETNILLTDPRSRRRAQPPPQPTMAEMKKELMATIREELAAAKKEMGETKRARAQNDDRPRAERRARVHDDAEPLTDRRARPAADPEEAEPIDAEPAVLRRVRANLIEKGVSIMLAESIVESVSKRTKAHEADDERLILSRVRKEITSRLRTAPPLEPSHDRPLIVMAVGSTGVGKTTTLAKLGALFSNEEARRIAYITLDRYRIAASEQLRTYSEILGVPFEEANDAEELSTMLERYEDMEIIFVDTAGRSVHRPEGISELRRIAERTTPDAEILLLVSSNTDFNEMNEIIKGFTIKDKVNLVFTKTDETMRWGTIFTAAVESQLPVAYVTNGQSVPYDIEPATSKLFADALLPEFGKAEAR